MRISLVRLVTVIMALASIQLASAGQQKNIVETAVSAGSFQTLATALEAAGLVEALQGDGPLTVFAPTDEAFAKLPQEQLNALLQPENKGQLASILTYHVVKGAVPASAVVQLNGAVTLNGQRVDIATKEGGVQVDTANVVKTDIQCSNGIIHVIDSVILPEFNKIPAVAESAGQFGTLLAAAKAAGLVGALNGEGPLTVFAPTDAAFAGLPEGTVENLLKPENKDQLASILKYHVVSGRVYSDAALEAGSAATLLGPKLTISASGGKAMVNNAGLVATDIDAANGVIHVIDAVLLPPNNDTAGAHPRRMIETAIAEGAPLYNAGHAGACADRYMQTVQQLMDSNQVDAHTRRMLTTAARSAQSTSCSDTRAWTLRRALDSSYHSMASSR
jgi:transforming growth factor-beta-induced protein